MLGMMRMMAAVLGQKSNKDHPGEVSGVMKKANRVCISVVSDRVLSGSVRHIIRSAFASVGNNEEGGILGEQNGSITHFYYDNDPYKSEPNIYLPNAEAFNTVISEWEKHGIKFAGLIHTHPSGHSRLSGADIIMAEQLLSNFGRHSILMPVIVMNAVSEIIIYKVFQRREQYESI